MQKPGTPRIIALAALLVLIPVAIVTWMPRRPPPVPEQIDVLETARPAARSERSVSSHAAATPTETVHEDSAENNDPWVLSREKLEEYLTQHHRDAASLLAAYHAAFVTEHNQANLDYLREAATNYPNDPHVQLAVLAHNAFPEERRKWLDAFKASSPDNSLANYLSAQEYFKNNQPDAAIKELSEATGKAQFTDHSMESYLGVEDLFRFNGSSPRITCTAAMAALSPEKTLPQFKGMIIGVADLQKQYSSAGDSASVENLGQMGIGLANRFNQGDGGRFLINQMLGTALENIALQSLNQNTAYDFLGGQTPAQRLEALNEQKKTFRELAIFSSRVLPTMSDTEMIAYVDRLKVYGEVPAMRWFQQQRAGTTPNTGN